MDLSQKIDLYTKHFLYDVNQKCFVLTDETDVVVCNEKDLGVFKRAGFSVFGEANTANELADLINLAEHS